MRDVDMADAQLTTGLKALTNAIKDLVLTVGSKSSSVSENGRLPSNAVLMYLGIYAHFSGFVYAHFFYRHFGIAITIAHAVTDREARLRT